MPQVVTDDFNRSSIGATDWLLVQGTAGIMSQSNTAWQPNDSGLSHTTYIRNTSGVIYGRDQYAKAIVKSVESSNYAGVAVRCDPGGAATLIFFHVSGYDRTVGYFVENTYTSLHNSVVAASNGDEIELRVVNNLITALVNGTVIYSGTVAGIPASGNYGIHGYTNATGTNNTALDSFEAGDIVNSQGEPMFVPSFGQDFTWRVSNVSSAQPASAQGAVLTPGNNSKGSWNNCLTALANDCWGIEIVINNGSSSAAARDILIDIGVDESGGSGYSVRINNLLGSCAGSMTVCGGIRYYFPLWIRAGSSIAARASVNNGTVGSVRVAVTVYGRPTHPEACKVGTFVDTFGATTASSSGTAVTAGTTSEGSWTQIGASTSNIYWWWQAGVGVNDSTMSVLLYHLDVAIGDASNKDIVIQDQPWLSDASERLWNGLAYAGCERVNASGANIYARLQASGTPDSNTSVVVYAVGG